MTNQYRRGHRSLKPRPLRQAMLFFLAFFMGYGASSFLDFNRVTSALTRYSLAEQSTMAAAQGGVQEASLPKPKLEFYTLLTAEHAEKETQAAVGTKVATSSAVIDPLKSHQPITKPTTEKSVVQKPVVQKTETVIGGQKFVQLTPTTVAKPKPMPTRKVAPLVREAKKVPVVATVQRGTFAIQVAAFRDRREADRMKATLLMKGFTVSVSSTAMVGGSLFRVMVGPFVTRAQAESTKMVLARREHVVGMIRTVS